MGRISGRTIAVKPVSPDVTGIGSDHRISTKVLTNLEPGRNVDSVQGSISSISSASISFYLALNPKTLSLSLYRSIWRLDRSNVYTGGNRASSAKFMIYIRRHPLVLARKNNGTAIKTLGRREPLFLRKSRKTSVIYRWGVGLKNASHTVNNHSASKMNHNKSSCG